MSPLHPAPVFGAKSAQNGRVRRVRFSCRTASGMPEPPSSLVFRRKPAPDVSFPLSARKSGEFQPAEHVTACHRFVTAVRQPAELVTTDVTTDVTAPSGSVFGAKSAQNVRVRRVRFSCRTASGMSEVLNSQVFGRKRAPDVSFPLSGRKSGEFQPAEHVTACHRFVTALFGAEKCAKGLEKRNQLRGFGPTSLWRGPGAGLVRAWRGAGLVRACGFGAGLARAWCGPGAGLVRAWCGPGAGLVRAWCGPGAGLVRAWCGPGNPVLGTGLLPQSCCGNRIAPAIPAPRTGLP